MVRSMPSFAKRSEQLWTDFRGDLVRWTSTHGLPADNEWLLAQMRVDIDAGRRTSCLMMASNPWYGLERWSVCLGRYVRFSQRTHCSHKRGFRRGSCQGHQTWTLGEGRPTQQSQERLRSQMGEKDVEGCGSKV